VGLCSYTQQLLPRYPVGLLTRYLTHYLDGDIYHHTSESGPSHCYSDGGISISYPAVFPIVSRIDRSRYGFSYGFTDGGKVNVGWDQTTLAGWR